MKLPAERVLESNADTPSPNSGNPSHGALPEIETEGDIETVLSKMSDEQVRALLIRELKASLREAEKDAVKAVEDEGALIGFIRSLQSLSDRFMERLAILKSGAVAAPVEIPRAFGNMSEGRDRHAFGVVVFRILLLTLVGFLANELFRQLMAGHVRNVCTKQPSPTSVCWTTKLQRLGLLAAFELKAITVAAISVAVAFFIFFDDSRWGRYWVFTYLSATVFVEVYALFSRSLLSPKIPELRLLPLNDKAAAYLHR